MTKEERKLLAEVEALVHDFKHGRLTKEMLDSTLPDIHGNKLDVGEKLYCARCGKDYTEKQARFHNHR